MTARSRVREVEANATKTARDVERLRGLLAKDEVSQQQFDAAVARGRRPERAAVESAQSQITEAEAGVQVSEGKLMQARAGEQQARAGLKSAQSGPEQVSAMRARAASAEARAQQAKAALDQAELNLQYTALKAPLQGHRQPEDRRDRTGRPTRSAADGHDPARGPSGSRRTSRKRS